MEQEQSISPVNYNLFFEPDLKKFTFEGKVEIQIKIQKPTEKMGLSKHQQKMIDIFKRLGLNVRVEYVDSTP